MYTSMIALVTTTLLGSAPSATVPLWQSDYGQALSEAGRVRKPLVVAIGHGANGWDKVVADAFSEPTIVALRSEFVCLYVDTDTPAGQKLADQLQLSTGPALVITDRTGQLQAYKRSGALPDVEVRRVLFRFADPDQVVRTTETSGVRPAAPAPAATSYYTPATLNYCPT